MSLYDKIYYYLQRTVGDGYFWIIWVLALIYIFIKHKREREFFVYPFILIIILVANPLTGNFLMRYLNEGSFSRLVWCFMIDIFVAYAATDIITSIQEVKLQIVSTVLIGIIIAYSGKWIFSETLIQKAENMYKLSDYAIHVGDYVEEYRKGCPLIVSSDILTEVRQYNSNVTLIYGRYVDESSRIENVLCGSYEDVYAYFHGGAGSNAEWLIMSGQPNISGLLAEYGWVPTGCTDGHIMYDRIIGHPMWD